ncbi:hypothetical protein BpHYR1_017791 [Brachionus plicatilis]|uniref:Uncharacterized protein n=1 Tax=Brachionus plicatilis TaxID=10195 RepID=A0A3M7QU49_BRAPC|nr:hypothetical protein BpHYR1_017791 [Brachionus plicatilis]
MEMANESDLICQLLGDHCSADWIERIVHAVASALITSWFPGVEETNNLMTIAVGIEDQLLKMLFLIELSGFKIISKRFYSNFLIIENFISDKIIQIDKIKKHKKSKKYILNFLIVLILDNSGKMTLIMIHKQVPVALINLNL